MENTNLRPVDWAMINTLEYIIEEIKRNRRSDVQTLADHYRLYGQLTLVWMELDYYMNNSLKDEKLI